MTEYLCGQCYLQGYCRELICYAVSEYELTPRFIRDVRRHARAMNLKPRQWKPFLLDFYQNFPGTILDIQGCEEELDTGVYDAPEIATWFRDLCRPLADDVQPRIRCETRERFLVTASLLRAHNPAAARLFGKEIANDNLVAEPQAVRQGSRECPYRHLSYDRRPYIAPQF